MKKAGSDIMEDTTLPAVEPGPVTPPTGDSTGAIFPLKHFHRESVHGPSVDTKAAGITKSIQSFPAEQSKLHVNQSGSVNDFPKPIKAKLLPITLLPKPLSQTQAVVSQTNPKAPTVRKVLHVSKTPSQQNPRTASEIKSHFSLRHVHKDRIHGKQPSVSDVKSKFMRRSSVNTNHQPAKPKPTDLIGNGAVFPLRHFHRPSIHGTPPPTSGDDMGVIPIPPSLLAPIKLNIKHEPAKQDGPGEQAIGAIFPLRHVHRPSIHGKPQTSVNSPDSVPEPPPLPPGMIASKPQSPKQTPVDTNNTAAIFPLKHVHRPSIHGELPSFNAGNTAHIPKPPPLPPTKAIIMNPSVKQIPIIQGNTAAIFPLRHVHQPIIHGKQQTYPVRTTPTIPKPPPLPQFKNNIKLQPATQYLLNRVVGAIFPLRHVHRPSIHGTLTQGTQPQTKPTTTEGSSAIPPAPPLPPEIMNKRKTVPKKVVSIGAPFPQYRPSIHNGKSANANKKVSIHNQENTERKKRFIIPQQKPITVQNIPAHLPLRHYHRVSIHGRKEVDSEQNTVKISSSTGDKQIIRAPLKHYDRASIHGKIPTQPKVLVRPVTATSAAKTPVQPKKATNPQQKSLSVIKRGPRLPTATPGLVTTFPLRHFHRESIHGNKPTK